MISSPTSERTYGDRSSIAQGTLPIHIKFSGTSEKVNLLDKLLVGANERRFALAGKLGAGAEVALSAGSNSVLVHRVTVVVRKARIVSYVALPDIECSVSAIWLALALVNRLFQPLWFDDGLLVLE